MVARSASNGKRKWLLIALVILEGFPTFVGCGKRPTKEPRPAATTAVVATAQPTYAASATPIMTEQSRTTPPPSDSSQDQALVDFVVRRVALKGDSAHLVAQVVHTDESAGRPIDVAQAWFLRCWAYQQKQFSSCDQSTFLENLDQDEQNPPWKHRYAVFCITSVDTNYETATVRLDYLAGPKAGSGTLITLKATNGQWEVVSQRPIWVS